MIELLEREIGHFEDIAYQHDDILDTAGPAQDPREQIEHSIERGQIQGLCRGFGQQRTDRTTPGLSSLELLITT